MWTSKHPPISWSKVCSSIEDSGMGIRDLKARNKTLLAKTLWNIHMKKDTLWVKWVHRTIGMILPCGDGGKMIQFSLRN